MRITIVCDDDKQGKLQQLRAKAIAKSNSNISFSDVMNFAIQYAMEQGFNTSKIVEYKEKRIR